MRDKVKRKFWTARQFVGVDVEHKGAFSCVVVVFYDFTSEYEYFIAAQSTDTSSFGCAKQWKVGLNQGPGSHCWILPRIKDFDVIPFN